MSSQPPTRDRGAPEFPPGAVTLVGPVPPAWPSNRDGHDGGEPWSAPDVITDGRQARPPSRRRGLIWYGGAAAAVVLIGLVAVLVLVLNGQLGSGQSPFTPSAAEPPDVRPPLARLCPPPTTIAEPPAAAPEPAPNGPRTLDEAAGISYRAYGDPWVPWDLLWRAGTLEVPYGVGQHFVTETYPSGTYHASILSAAVPAAVNDSMVIDLECIGRQVAADVRAEYYPQPNTMELMRDERTTLGGRPAWVTKFRLHFDEEGLSAKDELVSVALIDVHKPTAAVLYVSIPGTHHQWDYVVDDALASVRPT
jgi:hypothetical protein